VIYVGVDLGGTHIGVGLVDENGIIIQKETPTLAHRPYEQVLESIVGACRDLIEESGINKENIRAIGVGIPGIETPSGMSHAKNLAWNGVPLRADMSRLLGKNTYIDNDAHAAALAEMGYGNLKGVSDAIMLTLGTGVGGAMIVNGKILSGYNHAGGELGHITFVQGGIPCACGRRGCLEKYTAASALIRIAKEYALRHLNTCLYEKGEDLNDVTAKDVVDGVRSGDTACKQAFEDYCEYLSDGIVSFINMLNPQKICLGGGLSKAGDILFDKVREKCRERYFSPLHMETEIVPALLKNDAGILGAAMVAKQNEQT